MLFTCGLRAQINTERVLNIGRNALYFEDYILSIQYFNQVIDVKPYLAEPYFFRAVAKLSLEDYKGAEEDCNRSIERNPFITGAYQVRGIARQNLGDYAGAIEDYNVGLRYAPEDRTFLGNKAIAQVQLKDYDDAEKTFDKLIKLYPSDYNAYLSRSQFWLEKKDTLKAISDIDKAISIDKYQSYAYAQRAIIKFQYKKQYEEALEDMNYALKLDPNMTSYYLNRGIIRYYLDDLMGTMADYSHVVEIDPGNIMAHYNRGLLRMQVGDRNKAIDDFSFVLSREPDNFFALYNRAILYFQIGNNKAAIRDFDKVLEQYPDFADGYYARSEAKRKMKDMAGGEKDFKKAMAIYDQRKNSDKLVDPLGNAVSDKVDNDDNGDDKVRKESDKNINKFDRLLVSDDFEVKSKYKSEIRGRIQDRNARIEMEPAFLFTYYENDSELRQSSRYSKELEAFNRAGLLPEKLLISNDDVSIDTIQIKKHFASIDEYSKQIEANPENPIPYFARSLDFMLVQDYSNALDDLNRVINLNGDFIFAYFNRAAIRFRQMEYKLSGENSDDETMPAVTGVNSSAFTSRNKNNDIRFGNLPKPDDQGSLEYDMILRDYDKVISLDPNFEYAYFNRGNVRCTQKDFKAALNDFNEAIRLRPDFADAYFNRGLVYVYLGDNEKGIADLSKAGELGVVSAYSVIKRLSD